MHERILDGMLVASRTPTFQPCAILCASIEPDPAADYARRQCCDTARAGPFARAGNESLFAPLRKQVLQAVHLNPATFADVDRAVTTTPEVALPPDESSDLLREIPVEMTHE